MLNRCAVLSKAKAPSVEIRNEFESTAENKSSLHRSITSLSSLSSFEFESHSGDSLIGLFHPFGLFSFFCTTSILRQGREKESHTSLALENFFLPARNSSEHQQSHFTFLPPKWPTCVYTRFLKSYLQFPLRLVLYDRIESGCTLK